MEPNRTAPDFYREAARQVRGAWIPALLAVIASSLIAKLGTRAFIGLLLAGVIVVALRRYRLVLERRRSEP
jgi:hypothetical protein